MTFHMGMCIVQQKVLDLDSQVEGERNGQVVGDGKSQAEGDG